MALIRNQTKPGGRLFNAFKLKSEKKTKNPLNKNIV